MTYLAAPWTLKGYKDKSLSRYPEFEEYKANSGLLLPQVWGDNFQADTAEVQG